MNRVLPILIMTFISFAGCTHHEVEHEIGHKGRARVNPWLAAERFAAKLNHEARSSPAWEAPDFADSVWFVPGFVLSNESFTGQMEDWVIAGGHAVILLEYADSQTSDWSDHRSDPALSPALLALLERAGIHLEGATEDLVADRIVYQDTTYQVEAESRTRVSAGEGEAGVFASADHGAGKLMVLTDARIFRNRWIGGKQHAAFLEAHMEEGGGGAVVFMRGSGLSLWALLGRYLWPVLISLGALLGLWLWRNLSRFGPLDSSADAAPAAGYEDHLEALGDFQWRLNRGTALLAPLRDQLIERGQHLAARSGHREGDFFQFLADRVQIPRERVFRALVEAAPADATVLTRTAADLQRLSQVLNPPT